ncbi:unnamed protein product [Linum tenue]|uniref:Myb-like domain-containing protein n=1 Tax=Linum tenue TaxID=586396 RepID=A0AAV0GVR4_9ROSI|nr:unnamed protein product [Linum tenue]
MSDPPNDGDSVIWLWLIEYLASFSETDASLLHQLIEQAPASSTDFRSARERVALRCLEDLYASTNAVANGAPSASEPKVVIDLSNSCEDVIQTILQEISISDLEKGGPELLKWDIQPFIMHKKASMPKCALEQIKETIAEGSDSSATLLAKFSGLLREKEDGNKTIMDEHQFEGNRRIDNQSEMSTGKSISQSRGNEQGAQEEDLHDCNMLSSKGDEVDNNHGAASLGEQGHSHNGDNQLVNNERFQQDTLHGNMDCDNNLVKDTCKGKVQITAKENCHSEMESLRGVEGRENSSNAGNISAETSGQCIQAPSDDRQEDNRCEADCYINKMSQGKSDMLQEMIVNDEANESEPRIPSDTALKECHQDVSCDDHNGGTSRDEEPKLGDGLIVSGLTRSCNVEEENGHLSKESPQRDTGKCAHKRVNDDTMKSNPLNSQGLLSKEFMAAADFSGLNLCLKCSKNGQLLCCGTDGCPLAIHESCLGFTPSSDNGGQFCCPFCAYSLAISDYKKAKERASVMLKQLSAFLHEGPENPSIEHSKSSSEDGIRNPGKREGNQANNGEDVDQGNDYQFQNRTDSVQLESVPAHCVSNHPTSEQDPVDSLCVSRGISESEIKGTTQACPSVKVPDRKQDLDLPEPPCRGNNISREKKDVNSEESGQAKGLTEKEVPKKILEHKLVMPIRAVPMGRRASKNENDKTMSPNQSLILRKRKRKDAVSSPRRQAVKWTAQEEKKLKEGVEKFSNKGNIPWKSILEYGKSIFGDIRNPEDLRSKWKKMCKGQ